MKITNQEWAQLSAYVDGELSPAEESRLTSRLAAQPALRAALEDLQRTRALLSAAPRLKVPRDFTLTPAQVGRPARKSSPAGYQLAAAALSFLFAAVVVFDLGSGFVKGAMPAAMAPQSEELRMEIPPDAAADALEAETPPEEPAVLAAEAGDASGTTMEQEAEIAEEAAVPQAEAEMMAESTQPSEAFKAGESQDAGAEEESAAAEEPARAAEPQDLPEGEGEEVQNQAAPTAEAEWSETYLSEDESARSVPTRRQVSWIRILEVLLGAGAAAFGAAAWIQRRRRS